MFLASKSREIFLTSMDFQRFSAEIFALVLARLTHDWLLHRLCWHYQLALSLSSPRNLNAARLNIPINLTPISSDESSAAQRLQLMMKVIM
jgi:hypothetical protein